MKEEISHEFIAKKIDCFALRSLRLFIMSKLTFITEEGSRVNILIFFYLNSVKIYKFRYLMK